MRSPNTPLVALAPGIHRRDDHWVWVGGPVPRGSAAITLGRVVLMRRSAAAAPDVDELLAHELVHVAQYRRFGVIGFLRRYLAAYLSWRLRGYGHWSSYRRIPFETEAVWTVRTRSP